MRDLIKDKLELVEEKKRLLELIDFKIDEMKKLRAALLGESDEEDISRLPLKERYKFITKAHVEKIEGMSAARAIREKPAPKPIDPLAGTSSHDMTARRLSPPKLLDEGGWLKRASGCWIAFTSDGAQVAGLYYGHNTIRRWLAEAVVELDGVGAGQRCIRKATPTMSRREAALAEMEKYALPVEESSDQQLVDFSDKIGEN